MEEAAGAYAVRLWESDVTTFDPAIAGDLGEEAKLDARRPGAAPPSSVGWSRRPV